MKKEVREILEKPFAPEAIKQREGSYGRKLDDVEGHAVIHASRKPSMATGPLRL